MYRRAYTSAKNNCHTPMLAIFTVGHLPAHVAGVTLPGEAEITFFDRC